MNEECSTDFLLVARLSGGHQSGAYHLRSVDGDAVLKVTEGERRLTQLRKVQPLVNQMRALNYPMPALLHFGAVDHSWTYSIREYVEGTPIQNFNPATIELLLALLDQARDARPEIDHDWSNWVKRVLTSAESNYQEALASHSPDTRELLTAITEIVSGLGPPALPALDLVHGDFQLDNILMRNGKVAGVIDYEYAGKGSRVVDLATLAQSALSNDDTADFGRTLCDEGVALFGSEAFWMTLLYRSIEMILWYHLHRNETGVRTQTELAWATIRKIQGIADSQTNHMQLGR